jgi:hydroxyacid-oxoacid transhydrogenase
MEKETLFTMDTSAIKYGFGAIKEVGFDLRNFNAKRTMVLVDPNLKFSETVVLALDTMRENCIDGVLFDDIRIEPNDISFREAIRFAIDGHFDSFLGIGGGSTLDTMKVANLYSTYPDDFFSYLNPPIGNGNPVPGKLKPMVGVPTTAGTGSETTGTAIFDLSDRHLKTGIAHRGLRPLMGIIDPNTMRTLPSMVVACTGMDVMCHALETLLALPYYKRPSPELPSKRPAYQGANPISNIWATAALDICRKYLLRAVHDASDLDARSNMLLAATYGGIGFGNGGVMLPHAMAYPVAGMVRDFCVEDYPKDHSMIPHGMSVALNAPAVFRYTSVTDPELHLQAAQLVGADIRDAEPEDAGDILANTIIDIMKQIGMPNGLKAVGYGLQDIEQLVAGTLAQSRITQLSPRPVKAEDLVDLFINSLILW